MNTQDLEAHADKTEDKKAKSLMSWAVGKIAKLQADLDASEGIRESYEREIHQLREGASVAEARRARKARD